MLVIFYSFYFMFLAYTSRESLCSLHTELVYLHNDDRNLSFQQPQAPLRKMGNKRDKQRNI